VARGLNGKIWLPMNDTGYTFVIVLVIVWYLFRLVSRDRLIASSEPSKVFLVVTHAAFLSLHLTAGSVGNDAGSGSWQ